MEKENVLNKINDLLFSIQVKQKKLESYNILINDKLDSIRNYKNSEIALTLYNAQRNIDKYVILSYSISDKVDEVSKDIDEIYKQVDILKAMLKEREVLS